MTRTRKGSKGPGWEPWSNRHEKAEQRAGNLEREANYGEPGMCKHYIPDAKDRCAICYPELTRLQTHSGD